MNVYACISTFTQYGVGLFQLIIIPGFTKMATETSRVILAIEAHASGHVTSETKRRIHISVTYAVITASILGKREF